MLQSLSASSSVPNLIDLLAKFNVSYNTNMNTFIMDTDSININEDIVKYLVAYPEILRTPAMLKKDPNRIKFSLGAWLIGSTEISTKLAAAIFESRPVSERQLNDFAYICNYMRKYEPNAFNSAQIINFYNYKLDSELRPVFISLLTSFVQEINEECNEILNVNWREGRRDLAMASLQTLLKSNPPADFFEDFERFERVDSLEILTSVLLSSKGSNDIFSLFRNRICIASEGMKRAKNVKLTVGNAANYNWPEQWTRAIQILKTWPCSDDSIHPVDLMSKLTLSAINFDKSTFKSFYSLFNEANEEISVHFLSELVPETLKQCIWLHSCLPRPLMQLFAQLLKSPEAPQEILLALCQIFMDSLLGTSARKCFVNYLAAHAEDDLIGERCLGLIESFIERFPESRYVCLALIKSLLEGVDAWEPRLLVPFYSSFALMARASDSVMNDLILLLKKQIYSANVLYKRIGARGVGVFLSRNGIADRIKAHEKSLLPDPDDTFNDIASCSQKPASHTPVKCDYHLRIIISLLEESVKSLRSDPQSMLIFLKYNEECFDLLDDELKDWVGDWVRSVFQSSFITQIDEDTLSHKYEYEQDEDNPLALSFMKSELKDAAPILLSLLGKYEKYQNSGNLEGIDALQGCAIKTNLTASDLHMKFIVLNYFRTVLNTFSDNFSRLPVLIKIQQELKESLKMKPAFLSEFKLFPECHALIPSGGEDFLDFSIEDGSFLDEILKETRKSENRLKHSAAFDSKNQLCDLNETNFQRSLVPFSIETISNMNNVPEFLYKEIDCLIEFNYKNDIEAQRQLLDCLFKTISDEKISTNFIEIICKCKTEAISAVHKETLIKLSKQVLKGGNFENSLIQSVCKLIIDFLKCPDQISDPINLIKSSLISSTSFGTLKYLLNLPNLDIFNLYEDLKNTQIPLKNRLILLKSFGSNFSKKINFSSIEECQKIFLIWAELIQFVRTEGNMKLFQGIIKESHVVLDSFLSCLALKNIEAEALLLEGSGDRDSVILLLKTVQQSTRSLQIICNHLKYSSIKTSDPLAIPNLKKSLESVIFRVKEILTRSGCLGAFWMGNLKHRDLEGQELSSQVELLQLREDLEGEDDLEDDNEENNSKLSKSFINDSSDLDEDADDLDQLLESI